MRGLTLRLRGRWAHFKKPETNNNPLTHDFITKTALIGLIGAVTGQERDAMRSLFPVLSEDLLYGVQVSGVVRKESWAFTLRRAENLFEKAPKQMEFLKNPEFTVALALANERSEELFQEFIHLVQNSEAYYTPVLGLHNCPAEVIPLEQGEFSRAVGNFSTQGFVPRRFKLDRDHVDLSNFRVGFERIPTYQNNDFWNVPERYIDVIYPTANQEFAVTGEHYRFSGGSAWSLI